MKKYNLRCFTCTGKFSSKEDVYRDSNNNPICVDCLHEYLNDPWDYDYIEYIIKDIKRKFNRNYLKWKKWFYKNHVKCNGEHEDYSEFYEHKDNITEIDGKKYCEYCMEVMNWNFDGKEDV